MKILDTMLKEEHVFSELSYENVIEVADVAKIYAFVPKNWNSQYQTNSAAIEKYQKWLVDTKDKLKCLLVKDNEAIIGLHILEITTTTPDVCCAIKTLWVHESYRKKGIAKSLKLAGEMWARQQGAKILTTFVMVENPLMLTINKKHGFFPTRLEMRKDLN